MDAQTQLLEQVVVPQATLLLAMIMSLGLPFAVFALGSSQIRLRTKLCVSAVYLTAIVALSQTGEDIVTWTLIQVIALGFLTLCACGVCLLALTRFRFKGLLSWSLFGLLMVLFTLGPATLLPPLACVAIASTGWDLALASHSYLRDAYEKGQRPTMTAGLFFLLVNPCLVWQERGAQRSRPKSAASDLQRCTLGACALAFHFAALWIAVNSPLAVLANFPTRAAAFDVLGFVGYYGLRFLAGYAAHSGVASLKIGVMGLLGYDIPERYNYPWLAKDPADFWRRWNTYIGGWAKRYVFWPLAKRLQRRATTERASTLARGAAVLATFTIIGLLHDYSVFTRTQRWPLGGVLVFALNALALIGWRIGEDAMRRFSSSLQQSATSFYTNIGAGLSRTGFASILLLTVWIAIPTMSSDFTLTADRVVSWVATVVRP